MRRLRILLLASVGIVIVSLAFWWRFRSTRLVPRFDGQRAYQDLLAQVALGPRTGGSQAHAQAIVYIQKQLENAGWKTNVQDTQWRGFDVQNILAWRGDQTPQIILGAHYDSRMLADQDPGPGSSGPVPGANDGASGVAVLLELARSLPINSIPIELVFFDAEDDGGLDGRDWIMGSRAFVAALTFQPRAVIVVDMVGDADLNLYIERSSNLALATEIWVQAAKLGYGQQFIQKAKYSMEDDHTPFLEAGIPAIDIIDFDYPYWHTAADTPDKVSADSLQAVGETLLTWLMAQK